MRLKAQFYMTLCPAYSLYDQSVSLFWTYAIIIVTRMHLPTAAVATTRCQFWGVSVQMGGLHKAPPPPPPPREQNG